MKELSIEEKAKAYDEALERARCYKGLEAEMSNVFPELKESEDEKIRKEIIEYIKTGTYHKSWIAWLEKQGKKPNNVCDKELSEILGRVICRYINDPNISYSERENVSKKILPYVELLEKQNEQKPANTIEPKFKIKKGKWYVCIKDLLDNYANKAFRKGDIYLSTQDGSLIPSNSNVPYKVVCSDTYFRDWTINDAKDGDVLSYRDGQWIFIYKEKIDNNSFSYYTLYSTIYRDLTINDDCFTVLKSAIIPATKEQRDILMKAMADAGYTFDFEKKELKKIIDES